MGVGTPSRMMSTSGPPQKSWNFVLWVFFKVFIEFVTILLLFYVCLFVCLAVRHAGSMPSAFEGKILTTGPPRKSLVLFKKEL